MSGQQALGFTRHQTRLQSKYGPWAVITGASDGMGRGIAQELAKAGLNLILVARRAPVLADLAGNLEATFGIKTEVFPLDLAVADDIHRLVDATRHLDVGLLVAAAGYGTSGPLISADLTVERNLVDVNIGAVLSLIHPFARRFVDRRRGGLVLFGSLVGRQGVPLAANYAATKAYVMSLAEGLRVELAPYGVDLLVAAPGPVASGFGARANMMMSGATPAVVASRDIVAALGRNEMVVPGVQGKVLTYSLAFLPRRLRVRILARVMQRMTQHHEPDQNASAQPA